MSKLKNKILKYAFENGVKDLTISQIAYLLKEDRRAVDYAINKMMLTINITFRVVRLGIKKIPTKIFTINL